MSQRPRRTNPPPKPKAPPPFKTKREARAYEPDPVADPAPGSTGLGAKAKAVGAKVLRATRDPRWSYVPEPVERQLIRILAGTGMLQADLATLCGLSVDQLKHFFGDELAEGRIEMNANVAMAIYRRAVSRGDNQVAERAAEFWATHRAGYFPARDRGDVGEGGPEDVLVKGGLPTRPDDPPEVVHGADSTDDADAPAPGAADADEATPGNA